MIIILCGSGIGYPNGTAPTARVTAYARGLVEQHAKVAVLCLGTSETSEQNALNKAPKGYLDGVCFEYTCGTPIRGNTFIRRRWYAIKGLIVAALRVLSYQHQEQIEAMVFFDNALISAFWFWCLSRLMGAAYILEKNERPFLNAEQSRLWESYAYVYTHTVYKLYDGVIVISNFLQRYFTQLIRHNAKLLKLPILVDVDTFCLHPAQQPVAGRYIAYCGLLNEAKDGVVTLMRAFALIGSDFPDVKLVLVGDSYRNSQIPAFRVKAETMGISDRVIFTGQRGRDEIPAYLCNATALALARPASQQAEAGFPTKLGEYLATGNPTVITRVGEIDTYLQDGVSTYFVEPDNTEAFAERLRHVLTNPDEAVLVGQRGREVAKRWFDYRSNGLVLFEYIKKLRSR